MSLRDLTPWRSRSRSLPGALLNNPFRPLYPEFDRWLDAMAHDMDLDRGNGDSAMCHHPAYDFDDDALPLGCSWFAEIVERRMPAR